MKRKKIFITLLCTTCMIAGISGSVFAANGFNSQGSISFAGTDEQAGTSDDIIFDANDLNTIYNEVSTGKNLLATQITSKGAEVNKAGTIYTFNELKLGIDNVYNKGFLDAKEEIDSTKILKGQSILGIAGTATSDADAVAGDIRSGKTAYQRRQSCRNRKYRSGKYPLWNGSNGNNRYSNKRYDSYRR